MGGCSMGFFSWIILGLLSGALARLMMPEVYTAGLVATTLLGIVGALVGGFIGSILGIGSVTGLNLGSIFISAFGSFIVLFLFIKFKGK